jgi:ligand-binding sensor domain-containing protein/signal transduction histidine kinase
MGRGTSPIRIITVDDRPLARLSITACFRAGRLERNWRRHRIGTDCVCLPRIHDNWEGFLAVAKACGEGMITIRQSKRWGLQRLSVAMAAITLGVSVGGCTCCFDLNPSLDVSQYSQTARTVAAFGPALDGSGDALSAWTQDPAPAHLTNTAASSKRASPPKLSFTHLSVADGLSYADVRAIAQDRQGFMWFGTWLGGLNRYDGYTFKVYKHDDQDEGSLGCDSIWALYVDRTGVLWVGTNEGVDRYDRDTDSFVHYRHRADDPTSLPGYQTRSFSEDESGTLWVATSGGLSRLDKTNGRFFTFRPNPSDPTTFGNTNIRAICLDTTTGLLWVSTWNEGVSLLDRSTGHYTQYKNDPTDPASLSSNDAEDIHQDRAGNLWISTLRGLNRFDPKMHKFIRYLHDPKSPASLSGDNVTITYEDREGRFWVATNNGLNLMDRARGTFTRYLYDADDSFSLSSNVINPGALYVDASGALWIGTRSTGVDRVAGEAEKFTTYRRNSGGVNSLSNNVVTALEIGSAGELWIGTGAGLDRFDGHSFRHYLADPNDSSSLNPGPSRSIAVDSHGVVWTGTYGSGLDRLDKGHVKHFRHDPKNSDSLAIDNISTLVPDEKGGLWIGVFGKGMDYFDGRHFTHFPADPGTPAGPPDVAVLPLLLDKHGMLWIGTVSSGLVRFDTHNRKFSTYLMDPNQPGSQAANWMEDLYFDGASIWVASPTGLFRFDPETGKFTHHYTEKDGLPNNTVLGVLKDAQGNLWVGTANGLSRFDPSTETFRNYDMFDGLQGNGFAAHCHAKAPDGRLFFGGSNGLSAFYPDKLVDDRTPPPVVLTEFELFNKPVKIRGKDSPLRQSINVASSIKLRYNQSVFRFQFAALNYTFPQKNRYAYKLENFDRGWQYTDATHRFATYTNLDPGDYTFRVKASNNDGVWNEQGVALHIQILPPWWGTWWFRACFAAALLAIVWGLYQLRVRQLAAQFSLRLEDRVAERTRIARDLHDTLIQSFQGLMLRFALVSQILPERPVEAKEQLDRTIDRAATAIAEGRDAVQGLRASTVETNDLAPAVNSLGEELAADPVNRAVPAFCVTVEGEPRDLHPILRDEIYRIAAEALRNAFNHAGARQVEVEIRYDNQQFRLRVRDDGKGIDPGILSDHGREGHFGLPGMRERGKLIGGELVVWSEVGEGTEVELRIPAATAYITATKRFRISELRGKK